MTPQHASRNHETDLTSSLLLQTALGTSSTAPSASNSRPIKSDDVVQRLFTMLDRRYTPQAQVFIFALSTNAICQSLRITLRTHTSLFGTKANCKVKGPPVDKPASGSHPGMTTEPKIASLRAKKSAALNK